MVEAYAARQVSGEGAGTAWRRGVPATWPMAWTAICLAVFVAGWWLLVPHDPIGTLQPGPVDPTAGLGAFDLDRIRVFTTWSAPFEVATAVVPVVTMLVLGLTPVGARLTARIGSTMHLQSLRALCIAIAVVAIAWAVTLPVAAGLEMVNQAAGRLSGGWSAWAVRSVVQLAEWWAIAGLAVLAVRVSARLFRRSWWCVLTLVVFVLVLAGTVLSGRLAASDTRYPSLPDGPLRSDIVAFADAVGVGVSDVQVVPETPTTTNYNAYVTGVGDDHVVVLYETLLLHSTQTEVAVVAAHELGHVAEHDSDKRALLASLAAALVTAFVGAAATRRRCDGAGLVRRRCGSRTRRRCRCSSRSPWPELCWCCRHSTRQARRSSCGPT